jgi:hypothetical protein
LYGDFWNDQAGSDSDLGEIDANELLLPSVSAKLKSSTKFVKAEVLHQEPTYIAHIKLAPEKKTVEVKQQSNIEQQLKRDRKQDFKE